MMNKKEFLHLKSGTDVRGTAVETAEHGRDGAEDLRWFL